MGGVLVVSTTQVLCSVLVLSMRHLNMFVSQGEGARREGDV